MFTYFLSRIFNSLRLLGLRKHKRQIHSARTLLKKLSRFEHEGAIITYLRQINPYVFEELVLSIFEKQGLFVWRNRSYSGDGGIDGSIHWPGRGRMIIQSKRYSKSINPAHAKAFKQLALSQFKGGIFVHTGRTGDLSLESLKTEGLFILSGQDLAKAIKGVSVLTLLSQRSKRY